MIYDITDIDYYQHDYDDDYIDFCEPNKQNIIAIDTPTKKYNKKMTEYKNETINNNDDYGFFCDLDDIENKHNYKNVTPEFHIQHYLDNNSKYKQFDYKRPITNLIINKYGDNFHSLMMILTFTTTGILLYMFCI
jgi:hypothetical protein